MEFTYKKVALEDLAFLVETRIEVLRAANQLDGSVDMTEVRTQTADYYSKALADGSHVAYLVYHGDELAGTGGVSFFRVKPTFHNPSGNKAYLMNMYTRPAYRRMGLALRTLDLLVSEARERGVTAISLEATAMGRGLYEKYGFTTMRDEMELPQPPSEIR